MNIYVRSNTGSVNHDLTARLSSARADPRTAHGLGLPRRDWRLGQHQLHRLRTTLDACERMLKYEFTYGDRLDRRESENHDVAPRWITRRNGTDTI